MDFTSKCEYEVLQSLPSPESSYTAVAFTTHCGVLDPSAESRGLVVLREKEELSAENELIVVPLTRAYFQFKWLGPDHLEINRHMKNMSFPSKVGPIKIASKWE